MVTGMETTLFSRDTEAFALEPVEVTVGKEKRRKRKRKLVVDEEKIIQGEQMKKQIQDFEDLVKAARVAPPTKWRFVVSSCLFGVLFVFNEKLLCYIIRIIMCYTFFGNYTPTIKLKMAFRSDVVVSGFNLCLNLFLSDFFFFFQNRMLALNSTAKNLFENPVSFTTTNVRLNKIFSNNKTTKIPEDLIISSQEDEEVELEDPTEILRDANADTTNLPEMTAETTEIQEQFPLEEEERFEEPPVDELPPLDIEMDQDDEIQVPPPFQIDVTAEKTTLDETAALNESSAKDTEDEDAAGGAGDGKTDAQDKRWTKRTQQTLSLLEKAMKKKSGTSPVVNFKDLTKKCNRKQAAYRFYTLLTLSKEKCIHVEQDGLFADLMIHPGERFNAYS